MTSSDHLSRLSARVIKMVMMLVMIQQQSAKTMMVMIKRL